MSFGFTRRPAWPRFITATALAVSVAAVVGSSALANAVNSAAFSGGNGTKTVGTTLYARQGAALTLSVVTSNDVSCVKVTGAFTDTQALSKGSQSQWTFAFTAPAGDGTKTATVTPYQDSACTKAGAFLQTSYVLDNTGPTVIGAVAPAPNAAGWNHGNVAIAWSATDNGSGVASGPTPSSDAVTTDTPVAGVVKTATATDQLGNVGTGSVTVKRDTVAPTITHTLTPAPNTFGWNNTNVTVAFNCSDALSGIQGTCSSGGTATAEGSSAFSGTIKDNADNSASDSVVVQIDRTKPVVTGAPTTSPNANGWYNGNVTVHWTATDNLGGSGLDPATIPADSVVSGEGANLAAGPATVRDRAANTSDGASVAGIKIDRTAPNTVASAPTTNWNNSAVTVSLSPNDNLSGVAATHYRLDGGADATYDAAGKITIATDGRHTLTFWSVDNAGNAEAAKQIEVDIDQTPPVISHTQSPLANAKGWNRTDVTISYTCGDALSGIASGGCPVDKTIGAEGLALPVGGSAFDNAGNSTNDEGTVSIDKTNPTVAAAVQGTATPFGWYDAPVVVRFTCSDALSGVASCAADHTLDEGASQSAVGDGSDNADNVAGGSVSGVNVDTTPPTLTGEATTDPNANGWYGGDVTIHWTAADALSGLDGATVPTDTVVAGEGADVSASASVSDKAGNAVTAHVAGLRIDRTAPNTTATPGRDPDYNGWYTGTVRVTLNAFDGLSGVAATFYSVDGGSPETYTAPFAFGQGGVHTVRFWSSDAAGNVEPHGDDAHALTLKLDDVDPTIVATRIPDANAFGWNNGPVSVVYACSDNESGVDPAACPAAVSVADEGADQSVTRTAKDRAGNGASATVSSINIDLSAPTLSGEATTKPNANGWYRGDVTVHWTAADTLSGVDGATVPADSVVTGEGDNLGTGVVSVYDKAANKAEASVNGIHIDRTAPRTSASVPSDAALLKNGWYTGPIQVSLLGTDELSGVDATYYSVDGGDAAPYDGSFQFTEGGVHTITFWSVDKAGNVEDRTAARNSITVKLDNLDPTIVGARKPGSEANGFGWNNGPVVVGFDCADGETGIAGCSPDRSLSGEGAAQSVTGTATDFAGNKSSDTVGDINIDLTKPTLKGAATAAPNAAGWYNGDVTVHWTADDVLSGIDPATVPADTILTGEGSDLVAGPVTVKDKAGNESAAASLGGIKIDRTAPTITGGPTSQPNTNGWYTSSVKFDFSCSDDLSGVATCPSEQVLSGDGAGQSVTSAPAFDNAGNKADGVTVGGIDIDGQAPQTTAALDCDALNGYCRGKTATVVLTAADQQGLSGVAAIHYSVDGGVDQVVAGGTTSVDLPLDGSGTATIAFHAVDKADNVEATSSAEIRYDNIAPKVSHTLDPGANASGWDNIDTTVHFLATDDFSGVASLTPDVLVSDETPGRDVVGTATDVAGNAGTDTAHVKLDKTTPTIVGSRTPANANGWNNGDVTVHFACDDAMSGVAVCPDDVTVTEQGKNQSVTREAKDAADNTASATVGGIDIDRTKPTLTGAPTSDPNANGWYNHDVTVHWAAFDDLSGVAAAPADSTIAGEGDSLAASATVFDNAGNSQTAKVDAIKIDRTAPTTTIDVPTPLASGWYLDKVPVTLTANDPLSGIDTTFYTVDDGEAKQYTGVFDYDVRGVHTLRFWSVDRAGNVEAKSAKELKIDDVPPTIAASTSPAPTTYGWNNSPVTAHFTCSDAESGIAGCENDHTFVNEGANQAFTGTAVDRAGNGASARVDDVNIDMTKPTLVGQPTTDPNAAGWYRGDVTIAWVANDGLSGIDPASTPADSVITGEGANLGTTAVTVADKAGNVAMASIAGIRIDRTAPAITASKPAPGASGWYRSAVTLTYTCTDGLSGTASCPQSRTLSGDGADQSLTSGDAVDVAGNVAAGITTGGIDIDSKAPVSTAEERCTRVNNWCTGDSATIVITALDQAGLSGVKEIHYSVNGGADHVVAGGSASIVVPLSGTGAANVGYYAVDNAGNAEPANGVSLRYDDIAPTVTHTLGPSANASGWNNANTTVHFSALDDVGGSGVDPTTLTPDQVVAAETGGLDVLGQALDYAGNKGTDKATVRLDRTPPTITGAATTQPNANGWYSGPVTVHFTCGDALSGVASCSPDAKLTADGVNQQVTGSAVDTAGLRTDAIVTGIKIDSVKPAIVFTGVADGGIYTLGSVPVAGCTATDSGSGVAGACKVTVAGGTPNGVGTYTATASATDGAGNTAGATATYKVVYRWDGFLQPINDTAHQVGLATSIFKGGSTIPAKFQLKRADGTVVQANVAPQWLVPAKGSSTSAAVDETVYSDVATSGSLYSWDATGQQYQYNWGTKGFTSGFYYRVGVKLDDGQVYDVNLGLR